MEYFRLLTKRHYDVNRKRFVSFAFTNSKGGGISVVDYRCAAGNTCGPCKHIKSFYNRLSTEPPIFWKFTREIIEGEEISFELDDKSGGDKCHYNIHNLSNSKARN